jgi:thiol:disulfide interchange protein DsbA
MMRRRSFVLLLASLSFTLPAAAQAPQRWVEGQNYFLIQPPQPANVPAGKVEVTEVFSYGCPACNAFYPVADRLKSSLPANVQFDYLPASYNPAENWPTFQRAYFAALALGVAARAHDAMFNAIWMGGELAIVNQQTGRLKNPLPSIEDIAQFYHRTTGVDPAKFVAAANSFGVNVQMKHADSLIVAYGADSTPTIVVQGKYRATVQSAGGYDQLLTLVQYLVAKESH